MVRRAEGIRAAQDPLESLEAPPLGHATHALPGNGSEKGVFARILVGLAAEEPETKTAMIDATYLKTHRTATSLRVKKGGVDA